MPHGAKHPSSLPLPPLIAREIPWQCSTDDHQRWDDSEPALGQPEREKTYISVSWKQTDMSVWAAQTHEERLKPGKHSDGLFTQGRQQAAAPCDTAGPSPPQPPGGTCSQQQVSAQRPVGLDEAPRATTPSPFHCGPRESHIWGGLLFYYKWQGKVFNLSNWTGKYKVQLNFILFFNWSTVNLQCCVSFEYTATWFSYTYTCVGVFSGVQFFRNAWIIAHQASLFMGYPR